MYLSILGISIFSFWLLLSGYWNNPLLLLLGILSTILSLLIASRIRRQYRMDSPHHILRNLPRYLIWLIPEVLKANIAVIKNIWFPATNPITPTVRRIPMEQKSRIGQTIFANSITLTPGTVAFDVSDNQVLVHGIEQEAVIELTDGDMNPRAAALEGIGE